MTALVDEEIFKYVRREEYKRVLRLLKTGESKVIYYDEHIKIRIVKLERRVYTLVTEYGDKAIEEIVKNMIIVQA
ncbi:hypothetical protein [Clostridium sp.]|uniref:hypothetical protein n=1 Tax=Clostridium sp. TaxID=1506 RepID=UPI00399236D6